MYSAKRRPRNWFLSSKFLIAVVGVLVIGVSMLDGINYREIGSLLLVLALAFVIAHRSDKLHAHIDDLENRLTEQHRNKPA